jgi:hypothetical protein
VSIRLHNASQERTFLVPSIIAAIAA